MTRQDEHERTLERLQAVVTAYGGNVARWPDADQEALRAFAESDPEAQAIVRDGQRFDQLLDDADMTTVSDQPKDQVLADQIFSAITRSSEGAVPHSQTASGNVIDLADRRQNRPLKKATVDEVISPAGWMSVAALAASLVIGVLVGANGYLETATTGLGEIAGLSLSDDTSQFEDGLGPVEEDYL